MCPIHWAAFTLTLIPVSLGILGYLGFKLKRHDPHSTKGLV